MSNPQVEPILIPRGIIWECRQVAVQPVGAPASTGFNLTIPAGERALLLGGYTGPDNYGAGRSVTIIIRTTASALSLYRFGGGSVDNQRIRCGNILTSITETAFTDAVIGLPYMPFILPEGSIINVTGASLANTETLTGYFLIATRVLPPTVNIIGTGVTLSTDSILQV